MACEQAYNLKQFPEVMDNGQLSSLLITGKGGKEMGLTRPIYTGYVCFEFDEVCASHESLTEWL